MSRITGSPLTLGIVVRDSMEHQPPGGPWPRPLTYFPLLFSILRPCPSFASNSFHARCLWRFVETVSRSFPFLPASALLTGQGSRSFLCNEIICWLRPRPRGLRVKSAKFTGPRFRISRVPGSLRSEICSKIRWDLEFCRWLYWLITWFKSVESSVSITGNLGVHCSSFVADKEYFYKLSLLTLSSQEISLYYFLYRQNSQTPPVFQRKMTKNRPFLVTW